MYYVVLIIITYIAQSQNVTEYIYSFSDELESIMCNDLRVGGDKCDNKVYGVQDFINSFHPYFDNGIQDASILAKSVIERLNYKLNLRASFLENISSILQSKCLYHAYDNADTESLLEFTDLYFSGNNDRDAILPDDMEYNQVYESNITLSSSTYKLPNNVDYNNKYVQKDAEISELLDETMINLYDTHCKNNNGNDEYCSTYFGSINGVFRQYPGSQNSKTNGKYNDYDPRFRPWYVSAASGGKDVVILVDISGSMDSNDRIGLAKKAVKSVLRTLGQSSFVNVIGFSGSIRLSCFEEQLVPATARNVEALLDFVDTFEAGGGTDFDKAFNKAFDILEKAENIRNCHTSILFLTDGESSDPSDIISSRNSADISAVIFSYTLGEDADSEIPSKVSRNTNGVYSHINDGDENYLITKMSSYYVYYAYGIPEKNIIITSPYLDFDTKVVMITMAMSIYINETYFVGVAGTDIPLTFLSDAVGDITIGRKSYSFVINEESELILHPLIADVFELFDGDTSEYKPIIITDAEPDVFSESVLQSMLQREYGAINVNAEVKQPAGNVMYNGYIHEIANLLYIFDGVGPSSLSIGIVIYTESDINAPYAPSFGMKENLNVSNCKENGNITDIYDCLAPFNLYHRLDLMLECNTWWNNKTGILNGSDMNKNDEYYNAFFSDVLYSIKYPTYYLQSGLFESELDAFNTDPTCNELKELHKLTNRLDIVSSTDNLPFDGFRNEISTNILNSIYSLTSLHKFWNNAFLVNGSSFVSFFFGHYQGLHISYPGKIFKSSYNPLIRPWYQRAISYPDLFVWTTPYKHAVTNNLVIGVSTVILSPYSDSQSMAAFGVLGFDYEYSGFVTYWKNTMSDICDTDSNQYCFLIDSSGFLLYYDGMEYDVEHQDISYKFLGDIEPTIMQSLLERGFFINDTNANLKGDTIDISYIVDEDIYFNGDFEDKSTSFAYNLGTYTVHSISKTNLYLIYVEDYDLNSNIYPRDCPYNSLCSLVQGTGCIKQSEIEKIFVFKNTVKSTSKCETLTVDVCIEPESVIFSQKDIALACSSSIDDFGICILKSNQQSDICATDFVQNECDKANILRLLYLNVFLIVLFIFFVL